MKVKLRINTLILLIIYYCVFVDFPGFAYSNPVKYTCMVIVGMYIISNLRILRRKEFLSIHIALLIFSLILLYTSWQNRSVLKDRDPFLAAIVYVGVLAELYLVMEVTAVKGYTKSLINVFFYVTAVITVFTDILAVTNSLSQNGDIMYLVGTKFQVVYLHFFLIALYMARHNLISPFQGNYKFVSIVFIVVTLGMSVFTDCATGVVGIVLFSILWMLYGRHSDVLFKPLVFVAVLIVSFTMSFAFKFLLLWEPIQYVLTHYLNREITLSSRTRIFATVPILLKGHYTWGYGYGTTYELGIRLGGFPNTQNALWEWVWQCGVLGTVALVVLIVMVMHYASKSYKICEDKESKYILLLLYLFSMLASVEITINEAYLGYLAMMIPLTYAKKSG